MISEGNLCDAEDNDYDYISQLEFIAKKAGEAAVFFVGVESSRMIVHSTDSMHQFADSNPNQLSQASSESICRAIMKTGKLLKVSGGSTEEVLFVEPDVGRFGSVVCFPLFDGRLVSGALIFCFKSTVVTASDEASLKAVVDNVTIALQKALQFELYHLREQLPKALLTLNSSRIEDAPLDEILKNALNAIGHMVKSELLSLFVCDHSKKQTCLLHSRDGMEGLILSFKEGIVGLVASTGDTICVNNAAQDPRFYHHVDKVTGFNTRSILCIPIHGCQGKSQPIIPTSLKQLREVVNKYSA